MNCPAATKSISYVTVLCGRTVAFDYMICKLTSFYNLYSHSLMKKVPGVLNSTTVTPTAQEMQLKGSNLRIHMYELFCILVQIFFFITLRCKCS